ncbi:hypothetical protein [Edaphobacter aggregans]|uniref:hypothetical protein n=1 Tax=Edaphobacter aggregans TaxID=570835 RepID=UPI0005519966|nr:hypothetical protein [Edaphobacter aggregans]
MATAIEVTAECGNREPVRELERVAVDSALTSKDVEAHARAVIPSLPAQGTTFPPIAVPTTVRIRLDMESLTKQARNEDEELAIIVINRFCMIALLGATDRRCAC